MADIFISYSQKDRDRVAPLVEALTAEGYDVWWDLQIRAGESFDQLIEETLRRVRCIITVWSAHSVTSEWVRAESAWGKDRNKLVSVRIDDDVELPLKFYHVHTESLVGWDGAPESPAFRELVADVLKVAGPPGARIPEHAVEPESPEPSNVAPGPAPDVRPVQEPVSVVPETPAARDEPSGQAEAVASSQPAELWRVGEYARVW